MATYDLHLAGGAKIHVADVRPGTPVRMIVDRGLALRDRLFQGEPVATHLTIDAELVWHVDWPAVRWYDVVTPSTAGPSVVTLHTCGGPRWGRLTVGCSRCGELAAGAPRRNWSR